MPPLVQVAAPASQSALMLTGSPSSAPASSTREGGEGAFSNHLKAQQHGNQNQASDHARKEPESTGKPTTTDRASENSKPEKGRDEVVSNAADKENIVDRNAGRGSSEAASKTPAKPDLLANKGLQNAPAVGLSDLEIETPFATMGEQVRSLLAADDEVHPESADTDESIIMAADGNKVPLEDGLLPQQVTTGLVTESVAEEPVETASALFELEGAAALRQGEGVQADAEAISSVLASQTQSSELSAKSNPALSSVAPELALNLGKTIKASLLEGSTPKPQAVTQIVADALSNGTGPKENFEQVRQNIMAAMAGKSEMPAPVNLASAGAGHEASEAATQGLSFSNLSATLAATGTESARYTATQESTPPRFFTMQAPAGQPGWDVEVGNRIRWMVGQNNSGVELRLNPPELGSIEVKVATEGERTSITFFAANPAARDALELALPRLREMFADSGMQLANADVSDQSLQQEREQLSGSEGFSAGSDTGEAMILEAGPELIPGEQAEGRGVIDYYI